MFHPSHMLANCTVSYIHLRIYRPHTITYIHTCMHACTHHPSTSNLCLMNAKGSIIFLIYNHQIIINDGFNGVRLV
ncbi:uncharacterized protein DS421_11g348500 [Arachis hypogaea]|nr:uncharacterized protein DS421_11g348500 [Arachis hypogaea]